MTTKQFLSDSITPQYRPIEILITALHKFHIRKKFVIVDTRSNMQISDHKSKPHGGKSLRDLIDQVIGVCLYPTQGS